MYYTAQGMDLQTNNIRITHSTCFDVLIFIREQVMCQLIQKD